MLIDIGELRYVITDYPERTVVCLDALYYQRALDIREIKYRLTDWKHVELFQCFTKKDYISGPNLLVDEALCLAKSVIQSGLEKIRTCLASGRRRLLLAHLLIDKGDLLQNLHDIDNNGLMDDDCVIGVSPKEQCILP
ncbi:unnamed protein product [Enterobius vermicularis]|uniref:Transposase n=1 Tax=Enterobius vermicularis TaxID=51028 RepID=A0A0N4UV51_ENTVE|nr:unnamed protein product [Enterobius vermicularis]